NVKSRKDLVFFGVETPSDDQIEKLEKNIFDIGQVINPIREQIFKLEDQATFREREGSNWVNFYKQNLFHDV
ncbi:MAG: hypothetical protein K2X08_06310, partial [Chlamydiales bacterium]|nr:hypothetical protein [Chlamydiales bacterium]